MAPFVDVNINVDVPVNDRPAAVGCESLVGDFGRRGLMEQVGWGTTRRRAVVAVVFVETLSF